LSPDIADFGLGCMSGLKPPATSLTFEDFSEPDQLWVAMDRPFTRIGVGMHQMGWLIF
jgi:hypothetical protein